jgi:hypothetical protein
MDTATQRGKAVAPHMLGDLSSPTHAGHGRQIDLEAVKGGKSQSESGGSFVDMVQAVEDRPGKPVPFKNVDCPL